MSNRKHIFLKDKLAKSVEFSPKDQSFSNFIPERNIHEQAAKLRDAYSNAIDITKNRDTERIEQGLPVSNGFYIDIKLDSRSCLFLI